MKLNRTITFLVLWAWLLLLLPGCGDRGRDEVVVIGSKNFTEQFILAEIMAQLIEERTGLTVRRTFNLGGTMICHQALVAGEIDLYPEYTGSALRAILGEDPAREPAAAMEQVRRRYREEFAVDWLAPFGFNNTYALTIRAADAEEHGWRTISDLAAAAPELQAGFTAEFLQREDGYPGLREAYGLEFARIRDLDPGLMYDAIAAASVDVISAFSTDGRLPAYHLYPLVDDREFFPPYYAAPLLRAEVNQRHPQISEALALLAGAIDNETMQELNFSVDEGKEAIRTVARQFLLQQGLLEGE